MQRVSDKVEEDTKSGSLLEEGEEQLDSQQSDVPSQPATVHPCLLNVTKTLTLI